MRSAGYVLIVARVRDDAFTALFFDSLPGEARSRIRICEFGRDSLVTALAGATAVVLTRRGIFDFRSLSAVAGRLGIPRYYFLDDNFPIVREESSVYGSGWSDYTDDRLRLALREFSGVLLASGPLLEYFAERRLHARLIGYPPIAWPVVRARTTAAAGEPLRLAFFGGDHRQQVFIDCVYPAVVRLATDRPVELVVAGLPPSRLAPAAGVRVIALPYESAYGAALRRLGRFRIDALVHPTPPSRNNRYKNANILINARAVGAVPVLTNLPPYDTLGSPGPALLCDNTITSWHGALRRLVDDPMAADQLFERTIAYCEQHFSGVINARVIDDIASSHAPPGSTARRLRSIAAAMPLELDRAYERARRRAAGSPLLRAAIRPVRRSTS